MTEKDWKLLIALFEHKNITKTAAAAHVTQPALSIRLQAIEEHFGAQIVIRGKKGVQFTAEGEYLVRKAREIINEFNTIRDTLHSMKNTPSGVLRIGASHFFTKYILPGLLREFKTLYPAVEYKVQTGWSRDMAQLVLSNEVQVAFVRGNYSWGGIRRLLFSEHMCVARHEDFSLESLPGLPLIQYRNDPTNQQLIDNWWAEHFTSPPQVGMVVDRVDTCLEMVRMGLGYGFLPSTILNGVEGLHTLKMHYQSGMPLDRSTWMLLKEETAELTLVRAFITLVDSLDFSGFQNPHPG